MLYGDPKRHQGARVYGLKLGDTEEETINSAGFDHHKEYDMDGRGRPIPNKVNKRPYGSRA